MTEIKEDFTFEQDGKIYNLYDLPKDFVEFKGNLDLFERGIKELPDLSNVVIKGNFDIAQNELTSLKGFPKEVTGHCEAFCNKISSLKNFSAKIGGSISLSHNQISSLEGLQADIGGGLSLRENLVSSFADINTDKLKIGSYITVDASVAQKYGLRDLRDSARSNDFTLKELYESPVFKEEREKTKITDSKIKSSKMKVLRAIAKDNVSPEKGVIKPKRSAEEKKNIKLMLDSISKGIND